VERGQVYRRCGCRGPDGRQLGARCPKLKASSRHGSWTFAVDVTAAGERRRTVRRAGFDSKSAAQAELAKLLQRDRQGFATDDAETVRDYLTSWLTEKQRVVKPTTYVRYRDYIEKDLLPALGQIRLERLSHQHVAGLIRDLEAAGRGAVTIRRIVATLSSALSDAVKRRRVVHNPAQHAVLPEVDRVERGGWTVDEAVRFLAYAAAGGDRDLELWETLIGTGLRKGECLALRWADLDLEHRVLHVRQTLSSIDNSRLVFTTPKTRGSAAGVGLSRRVIDALHRQRARQTSERTKWGTAYQDHDLVFARENGLPLRPEYVLRRFRSLANDAGLPRARVHDLRHLAASMMIAAGVPLPIVSKTLRHSGTGITADLYAHLTRETAHQAVDAMAAALDAAETRASGPDIRPSDTHRTFPADDNQ
jgi:integrase